MSFLNEITKGKKEGAQIHVIFGDNGVGKTTWAASFPGVLIADLEGGSNHLDVERISSERIPTLDVFRAILKELINLKHSYKTFVIDSIESLESLISDAVCAEGKVKSIELYDGGYGKGYIRSREIMREIMADLQSLRSVGITSIIVGHAQVKSKTDPATNQTWDRIVMRCNDKMASVVRDLADNVFYATVKIFTTTENRKVKAYGDGQRIMYTQFRPGFDSKNRLDLPLELPLSYEAFIEACNKDPKIDVSTLLEEISEMSAGLSEEMKKTVSEQVSKFSSRPDKLKEIKNRLMKFVAA